jgi:hypothetical protein
MKIKELLSVDQNVGEIWVDIYNKQGKPIRGYVYGKNSEPYEHMDFIEKTKMGEVYNDGNCRIIFVREPIHYFHLSEKEKARKKKTGTQLNKIPKEILDLKIKNIVPYGCGYKSNPEERLHMYFIGCVCPDWTGLPGENEVIE